MPENALGTMASGSTAWAGGATASTVASGGSVSTSGVSPSPRRAASTCPISRNAVCSTELNAGRLSAAVEPGKGTTFFAGGTSVRRGRDSAECDSPAAPGSLAPFAASPVDCAARPPRAASIASATGSRHTPNPR